MPTSIVNKILYKTREKSHLECTLFNHPFCTINSFHILAVTAEISLHNFVSFIYSIALVANNLHITTTVISACSLIKGKIKFIFCVSVSLFGNTRLVRCSVSEDKLFSGYTIKTLWIKSRMKTCLNNICHFIVCVIPCYFCIICFV